MHPKGACVKGLVSRLMTLEDDVYFHVIGKPWHTDQCLGY